MYSVEVERYIEAIRGAGVMRRTRYTRTKFNIPLEKRYGCPIIFSRNVVLPRQAQHLWW